MSLPENIKNFIFDSAIKSYRNSPQFVCIDLIRYRKNEQEFLEKIFSDPNTEVDYILDSARPSLMVSYILFNKQRNILHYIYTAAQYRHKGHAKSLLNKNFPADKEITTSHHNKTIRYFMKEIKRRYKYQSSIRYE